MAAASACDRRGPSQLFQPGFPVGTNNLHPTARTGIDRQPEAVQLDDRGHQIQTKTYARRISYFVGAIETPQYSFSLLFADAAAGIGHAHDGFGIAPQQFDIYLPAG